MPNAAPRVEGALTDFSGRELSRFYAALAELRSRPATAGARLDIVELGDSHTAGDAFTNHLRRRLQADFGDAGRGYLLPGKPMKHYYQRDAQYRSAGPWLVERGLKRDAAEPLGMAGVRVHSDKPAAQVMVGTCTNNCPTGGRVSRIELFYGARPDGGRLEYRVDEEPWETLDTRTVDPPRDPKHDPAAAPTSAITDGTTEDNVVERAVVSAPAPAFHEWRVPDGQHQLWMRPAGGGPVDLFGVAFERDQPGVVFDSLGIVGARAWHLWHWDWKWVAPQLAHRDPRLVILQYGTNETDEDNLDAAALEQRFVDLVGRVREAVPNASILILGAPDRGWRARKDCDGGRKKKGKRARVAKAPPPRKGPPPPGCEWRTPDILRVVLDAERRAAERTGVAFFDQFTAMGGADQMDKWVTADPALAYPDRVHFTRKGYEWAGDLLLSSLMAGLDAYLGHPHPAVAAPAGVAPAGPDRSGPDDLPNDVKPDPSTIR